MKRMILGVLAVLAMVALSRPAMANTLTVGGVDYTVTTVGDDIQLVIDFSGATSSGDFFSFSIDFGGNVTDASILSQDTGLTWSDPDHGTNNPSGCNFNGGGNKWCTQTGAPGIEDVQADGGTYTFLFDITGNPNTFVHLQAFQGQGGLAISCDIGVDGNSNPASTEGGCGGGTEVPEPGSLMLFGTGLLSMAGFLRRKLFA
jgi:PEP-CTERM motif